MGRCSPTHRLDVLRRLRRQDVCSPHKQRKADSALHLWRVCQGACRCALLHAARIMVDSVLTLISDMFKAIAQYSKNDRTEFIKAVQDAQTTQQTTDINKRLRFTLPLWADITAPLWRGCPHRRGTGGTMQKRGT